MEDGMEEEFWYGIWKISGMETGKGMEDFKNGMECHLLYFPYLD